MKLGLAFDYAAEPPPSIVRWGLCLPELVEPISLILQSMNVLVHERSTVTRQIVAWAVVGDDTNLLRLPIVICRDCLARAIRSRFVAQRLSRGQPQKLPGVVQRRIPLRGPLGFEPIEELLAKVRL